MSLKYRYSRLLPPNWQDKSQLELTDIMKSLPKGSSERLALKTFINSHYGLMKCVNEGELINENI